MSSHEHDHSGRDYDHRAAGTHRNVSSSGRHMHMEEQPDYAQRYHDVRTRVNGTLVYTQYWNDTLLSMLPAGGFGSVLDLMCGDGVFLSSLDSRFRRVVGLDISMPLLKLVPLEFQRTVVRGDALSLPFPDNAFDAVVVRGALHHLPSALDVVFAETRRVLRKGGTFLFLEPSDDNVLFAFGRKIVYRTLSHFAEHERGLTSSELVSHLRANGFSVTEIRRSGALAYVLLLNTDAHPLLRKLNSLPFSTMVARALVQLDRFWESLPILKRLTLNVMISSRLTGG